MKGSPQPPFRFRDARPDRAFGDGQLLRDPIAWNALYKMLLHLPGPGSATQLPANYYLYQIRLQIIRGN